jgi:hypothetical protein
MLIGLSYPRMRWRTTCLGLSFNYANHRAMDFVNKGERTRRAVRNRLIRSIAASAESQAGGKSSVTFSVVASDEIARINGPPNRCTRATICRRSSGSGRAVELCRQVRCSSERFDRLEDGTTKPNQADKTLASNTRAGRLVRPDRRNVFSSWRFTIAQLGPGRYQRVYRGGPITID